MERSLTPVSESELAEVRSKRNAQLSLRATMTRESRSRHCCCIVIDSKKMRPPILLGTFVHGFDRDMPLAGQRQIQMERSLTPVSERVGVGGEYYGKIMEVIDALDSTDSSAVAAVKSLPSEQLLEDILFIDSNFKIVSKSIILLESSKLQLSKALNIVDKVSQILRNLSTPIKCYFENDERDLKRTKMTRRDETRKTNATNTASESGS
ncbi:hypothetical protein ANN_13727 [Periplaneta americana]|uniref:Uncharacterized protein n=1 Tax=Periplaneta americana TaxID=6978 RepID=A0ABQ8SUC7_PERAM|nr:hypothetical protein ANN_13727 [Periplaneta americana]